MRAAGELVTTKAITLRRCFGLAIVFVLLVGCGPQSGAPKTFVVPEPSSAPVIRKVLPNASWAHPAPEVEIKSVFELFYKARTLARGGQFDVEALRGLVEGAYADYTLPLFDREVADAKAGVLQQVSFRNVTARLVGSYLMAGGSTGANVQATRTREETRKGAPPTSETATYTFRAERKRLGADGVSWAIFDFLNPSTQVWISEEVVQSDAQVASELKSFFDQFYAARSLAPAKPLERGATARLVAGSYAAY